MKCVLHFKKIFLLESCQQTTDHAQTKWKFTTEIRKNVYFPINEFLPAIEGNSKQNYGSSFTLKDAVVTVP